MTCLSSAARALHRLLEWKNHGVPWPSHTGLKADLLTTIIKRINEASGIYQMFSMLGDIILLRRHRLSLYTASNAWVADYCDRWCRHLSVTRVGFAKTAIRIDVLKTFGDPRNIVRWGPSLSPRRLAFVKLLWPRVVVVSRCRSRLFGECYRASVAAI